MKYLLFVSFDSGLMHNAVYENLSILYESILQLVDEEKLDNKIKIPTFLDLQNHFINEDDFLVESYNGTWFHIQEFTKKNYISNSINEEIFV